MIKKLKMSVIGTAAVVVAVLVGDGQVPLGDRNTTQ